MFYCKYRPKLRPDNNKNPRNDMKRNIIAAIAAFALLIPAMAQSDNHPYIMQNSTCEQKVTPDELYVSITINEKDNKGKKSVEQLQEAMIKELEAIGIDVEKNLTLNDMGSEIAYSTFKRSITPRTSATYMLKLGSAATMQRIIDRLEQQGITNIQLVRTRYSKEQEIYLELGTKAMKQAKQEAASLASAIGQSIGPALSINSNKYSSDNAMPRLYKARNTMLESADIAPAEEPEIEIEKITFTVNVNVKFLLNEE